MRPFALVALFVCCSPAGAEVRSSDFTGPWQTYAHDLLRDSVAFQSYRGAKQVVPLTEFLANEFIEAGFLAEDVHILPLDSNGEPAASLVVRYRGKSNTKRPILFSAHTDVVGAVESKWDSDPFTLSEGDGFYYGRGVFDNKFGTTVLATTFLRLKKEGFTPERDLIIAFSGDEESEQWTIKSLVQDHLDLIDAEIAFILDAGEGRLSTQFEPIATFLQFAEKTYVTFELTANNPGGHSSKPPPDNAIADLAQAIVAIHEFNFPVRSSVESRAYFATMGKLTDGELGAAMRQFAENPDNRNASDFLTKHREYVGSIRTTCVPTIIRGGHTENVLPETVTVTINCRLYPGISVADTEATLKRITANPAIEFQVLGDPMASPASPVREDVVALIEAAMNTRYQGVPIVPYIAPGGTDGVYLRSGGITSYGLYGLFLRAEDDNSHASNEKLSIEGFYEALDFWYTLTKNLAAL